jgi:hypothetical protein
VDAGARSPSIVLPHPIPANETAAPPKSNARRANKAQAILRYRGSPPGWVITNEHFPTIWWAQSPMQVLVRLVYLASTHPDKSLG